MDEILTYLESIDRCESESAILDQSAINLKEEKQMSLMAVNKVTGERRNALEVKTYDFSTENLVCQYCNNSMIFVGGKQRVHHFRHKRGECDYSAYARDSDIHPNESIEHIAGKVWLKEHLQEVDEDFRKSSIEFEVPIKEVGRIVDVLAVFPSGTKVAHEVQLSSITLEELQKRTDDYASAGIDVWWWLGKNADTPGNRSWCMQKIGCVCFLDFGEKNTYRG